jgi:hypothetical protein
VADDGPEDEVIDSIWAGRSKPRLLTVRIGEVHHAVTEPIVIVPFLLLVMVGWIGLVAFLPPDLAGQFIDVTFGWVAIHSGDRSATVWVSLVGVIVGLVAAFIIYAKVYGAVIGWFLGRSGEGWDR